MWSASFNKEVLQEDLMISSPNKIGNATSSIRFWPVTASREGLEADCRAFIENVLTVPELVTQGLEIELTKRIDQPKCSKIHEEVLIRFQTSQQRDIVQLYAVNLAKHNGRAGLRMEIPQFLEGVFKMLLEHAGILNQRFPGVKRSVKFDDINWNLAIDIKLPHSTRWHRFTH